MLNSPSPLKNALRRANKILNNWVERHSQYMTDTILKPKRETHQEKWQELASQNMAREFLNQAKNLMKGLDEAKFKEIDLNESPVDRTEGQADPRSAAQPVTSTGMRKLSRKDKKVATDIASFVKASESTKTMSEFDDLVKLGANMDWTKITAASKTPSALTSDVDSQKQTLAHDFSRMTVNQVSSFHQSSAASLPSSYNRKSKSKHKKKSLHEDGVIAYGEYEVESITHQLLTQDYQIPLCSADMFVLYLYQEDQTDDDIILSGDLTNDHHNILREMKQLLKGATEFDPSILHGFFYFLLKLNAILLLDKSGSSSRLDYAMLEKWAQMGCWFVSRGQNHPANLKMARIFQNIASLTLLMYSNLAYRVAERGSDLNVELAESILATATEFMFASRTSEKIHKLAEVIQLCTTARLAFLRQDFDLMQHSLDQAIVLNTGYTQHLFTMLHLAGNHFEVTHPALALRYFLAALALGDQADKLFREQIGKSASGIVETFAERFKENFSKKARVALPKGNQVGLIIFIPFDTLPKNVTHPRFAHFLNEQIKIIQVFDNHISNNKKITGLKFETALTDPEQVIPLIQAFKMEIAASFAPKTMDASSQSRTKEKGKHVNISKPVKTDPVISPPVPAPSTNSASILSVPSSSAVQNTYTPLSSESTKPSKPVPTRAKAAPIPVAPARRIQWPRTIDCGFTACNRPVTPIYTTHEAMRLKKTRMFAVWEEVPEFREDQNIIEHFRNMLQPLEGLLIVRKRGEAGAKLESVPNDRADEWGNCFLRLKAIGEYGNCRVFAKNKQRITVENDEGKQENRYLFSFGVAKYK